MNDTIFALSSGAGRAAVAVIRISGPASATALSRLAGDLPPPRHAALRTLRSLESGLVIDRGLVLWFPAPHSFSGEDCVELQVHGSRAVVAAVLEALRMTPGCRLAQAGEFTRRAFSHGKLDLAAVEGLADLIDAQTEAQRRQALFQLDGSLGQWVTALRSDLLEAQALAESSIDFADEGDIGKSALEDASRRAGAIADTIRTEMAKPPAGERIRDGFVVALVGPPNAGKSTLLNALAQREAAIVSPHPGTTRDPVEVNLDLAGFAVTVIDTAGMRATADPIEMEGIARARARAEAADLVLWLQDAREDPTPPSASGFAHMWVVATKSDLAASAPRAFDLVLSAKTGDGVAALLGRLQDTVATALVGGETALVGRLRHRMALEQAEAALRRAAVAFDAELAAEDLRAAGTALGAITGKIDTEEILGAIFSRFCIGK